MKDAGLGAAGAEENAAVAKGDGGAAGGEGALFGKRGGHVVAWEFRPVLAIGGV
jgi:hypothetical protein